MQLRKDWVIPTGVGITSFIAGVGVGYVLSNRQVKARSDRTDANIEALRAELRELKAAKEEFPSGLGDQETEGRGDQTSSGIRDDDTNQPKLPFGESVEGLDSEPELRPKKPKQEPIVQARVIQHIESGSMKDKIDDMISEEIPPEEEYDDPGDYLVSDNRNVWDDEWDWDLEERLYRSKKIGPNPPYVIHKDEYDRDENDWGHEEIIYYAGDSVYVDRDEKPIHNFIHIVGDVADKFGHGSKDPNIVFVRNEKIEMEYEILRHEGHYSEDVLGIEIEHAYKANRAKKNKQKPKFKLD